MYSAVKKLTLAATVVLLFGAITAIIIWYSPRSVPVSAEIEDNMLLIIDPGHGGMDGGAVAADGTTESEINFAVSGRLYDLCRICGIRAVMTRFSADIDYPPESDTIASRKVWDQHSRVNLINSSQNAVLMSIHQNFFPDPRPSGCQVFYAPTENSRAFGEGMHRLMTEKLDPQSRRVACPIGKDIYLMNNVHCPGILVECGFMSNERETNMLKSPEYQAKLALVLMAGFLQYGGKYEG